ncbi:hypothetical protein OOA_18384 [Providencia burhodogranariea DSM 19968]|uniref:Uncharacterized protein n=1 Tax=Providencia burhodogranariea DSM 19968 TaxID=1141662 RepID=K8VZF5_9GAMM|nr:hypothetical protein OOA_18384 [Providencia burhodogranariea DSM 19968]
MLFFATYFHCMKPIKITANPSCPLIKVVKKHEHQLKLEMKSALWVRLKAIFRDIERPLRS